MSTHIMKDIPTVSKYVLTATKKTCIKNMNAGILGNTELGIFEIVGYHSVENKVMVRKPTEGGKSFIIPMHIYLKTFIDFMPIILHNN